nr:MAG TPA: hypothetical protein [Bacteriophage sp.]
MNILKSDIEIILDEFILVLLNNSATLGFYTGFPY